VVFLRNDRVGLAFTVERRKTGDSLMREDAEEYALQELRKAGIKAQGVIIEAFESQTGWLVFCTVDREKEISLYIRFDSKDDFLDAVSVHGTDGVQLRGWEVKDYFTARVTGPKARVAEYITRMSEYGSPFEAPAVYAIHLEEQSAG